MGCKKKHIKYRLESFLNVLLLLAMTVPTAHAVTYKINYSGTFTAILDASGNTGGSFSTGAGVVLGDTYNGVFSFNTQNTTQVDLSIPIPNVTSYDFGVVFPEFAVNGGNVNLESMVGISVGNDIDPTVATVETYIEGGLRELGFNINTLPASVDFLSVFADVSEFDSSTNTGSEILLSMFDLTGSSLSGNGFPDPLSPLNNSFLIYLETINGTTVAAGIGTTSNLGISVIPVPPTFWLFGSSLVGLIGVTRSRKHQK